MNLSHSIGPVIVVLAATLVAAITDVRSFRVYNVLTFPLLLGGLAYHAYQGGTAGFLDSLAGCAVGFAILIIPYAVGAMGAGDVKLLAGLGAWLGVTATATAALIGCVCTGIYALVVLLRRGGFREAWLNVEISLLRLQSLRRHLTSEELGGDSIQDILAQPDHRRRLIPFSVMLGIGVLVVVFFREYVGLGN